MKSEVALDAVSGEEHLAVTREDEEEAVQGLHTTFHKHKQIKMIIDSHIRSHELTRTSPPYLRTK